MKFRMLSLMFRDRALLYLVQYKIGSHNYEVGLHNYRIGLQPYNSESCP